MTCSAEQCGCVSIRPSRAARSPISPRSTLTEVEIAGGSRVDRLAPSRMGGAALHRRAAADRLRSGPASWCRSGRSSPTGRPARRSASASRTCRMWGLGLQPLGWAKFVERPPPAAGRPLGRRHTTPCLRGVRRNPAEGLYRAPGRRATRSRGSTRICMRHAGRRCPDEARIVACHDALARSRGGDRRRAAASMLGMSAYAARAAVPPPFRLPAQAAAAPPAVHAQPGAVHARSLAQVDRRARQPLSRPGAVRPRLPPRSWGMTPREYAALPHPILGAIMRQRMADQGVAAPLDLPTIARYAGSSRLQRCPEDSVAFIQAMDRNACPIGVLRPLCEWHMVCARSPGSGAQRRRPGHAAGRA